MAFNTYSKRKLKIRIIISLFFFFTSVNNEIVILINFRKKMRLFVKGKKKMKNKVHAQILRFLSKKKIVKLETTILRNIPSVKITKIQNVLLIKNCHIKGPPKEECQNLSVCFKDIYLSTT